MIDIDHFKKVNDTYGHQAGDFVLASTAKIILAKMRSSDYVCRYGGEEFIAILPGTELAGAARAAEKIRQEIANFVYDLDGTTIPITASFGVAQLNPDKEDGKKTIARADAALYRAKQAGRNRVCIENGDGLIADFTSSAIQPDS
jgi:diguanylate cyclase (GGDEF)-like protein